MWLSVVSAAPAGQPTGTRDGSRRGLKATEVCQVVGITYRQLDFWARIGLLGPSMAQGRGSGNWRAWSYADLLHLKVVERLVHAGLSPRLAQSAVDCLRSSKEGTTDATLVLSAEHALLVRSAGELAKIMDASTGPVWVLAMGKVVSELEDKLAKLAVAPDKLF
ncbi:MAG: MerR family transcriptional regulator [Acidimicrobiales bacterium]